MNESSQRLSDKIKISEPQMPWRELAGFRNVIVHGYLGVDLGAVWSRLQSLQDEGFNDSVSRQLMSGKEATV